MIKKEHTYLNGKLNLPFVGFPTFLKSRIGSLENLDADIAIVGVPNDMGTQYRSGARFGPRAIREASTLYAFGHAGVYDFDDKKVYLEQDKFKMVDVGDVDIIHTDMIQSHKNTTQAIRAILSKQCLPLVFGGDHSITAAVTAAFQDQDPFHLIHFDAHLDYVDERHGVRFGHGNCLRRCSEMRHIKSMTHI